jgi:hypothetical protein
LYPRPAHPSTAQVAVGAGVRASSKVIPHSRAVLQLHWGGDAPCTRTVDAEVEARSPAAASMTAYPHCDTDVLTLYSGESITRMRIMPVCLLLHNAGSRCSEVRLLMLGDSKWWKWRCEEPKPYSNSGNRLVYFFENLIFLKNL